MTRDDFETWLFVMDDELEAFMSSLTPQERGALDYTPTSIPVLERIILDRFPGIEAAKAPENRYEVDRLARYLGEAIRKTAGGKWDIELEDEKYAFFGIPVVKATVGEYCPPTLVTATTDRRTGVYLERIFAAMQRRLAGK